MGYDANKMSLEELEDCSCLEELSDINDSSSDFSEIDSDECIDSKISEVLIEREIDEEDADRNACRYQNDVLLFRLEQSEEREALLQRELEKHEITCQNDIELKR